MNRSETITEIAKALAKFQSEVSDPNKRKCISKIKICNARQFTTSG